MSASSFHNFHTDGRARSLGRPFFYSQTTDPVQKLPDSPYGYRNALGLLSDYMIQASAQLKLT
jgi:hypothetical protein